VSKVILVDTLLHRKRAQRAERKSSPLSAALPKKREGLDLNFIMSNNKKEGEPQMTLGAALNLAKAQKAA